LLLSAFGLMAALALLYAQPAHAEGEVKVDAGGTAVESEDAGGGMPSSNPRVRSILAAHPDRYVVACVAGCDGKPQAVQILPRSTTARVGGYRPSMAKMGREIYGPPSPSKLTRQAAAEADDVICVAGCNRRPGQIVQRLPGLPPLAKPKANKQKSGAKKRDTRFDLLP
jgi:hypothetical protein